MSRPKPSFREAYVGITQSNTPDWEQRAEETPEDFELETMSKETKQK